METKEASQIDLLDQYTVTINKKPTLASPLGVNFNATNSGAVQIKSFARTRGDLTFFEATGYCGPGDVIVGINEKSVVGKKFARVQKRLAKACVHADTKPVKIVFTVVEGEFIAKYNPSMMTIGAHIRTDSLGHFYLNEMASKGTGVDCPGLYPGLIILRVNGFSLTGLGRDDGMAVINQGFSESNITKIRFADPSVSRKYTSSETMEAMRKASKAKIVESAKTHPETETPPNSPFSSILMDRTPPSHSASKHAGGASKEVDENHKPQNSKSEQTPARPMAEKRAQRTAPLSLPFPSPKSQKLACSVGEKVKFSPFLPGLLVGETDEFLSSQVPVTFGLLHVELLEGKRLIKTSMTMENKFQVVLSCDGQYDHSGVNEKPASAPKWNVASKFRIFTPDSELLATIYNAPTPNEDGVVTNDHYTDHVIGEVRVRINDITHGLQVRNEFAITPAEDREVPARAISGRNKRQ